MKEESMHSKTLKSDSLMLLTAAIWGFAFVAQRVGMDYVGPFTYNGVRFALGSLSLIPLIFFMDYKKKKTGIPVEYNKGLLIKGGLAAGFFLFIAASLQQVGLVYTTAGKAGFITGLYVVIVPILGLFWRQRPGFGTWLGAVIAAVGLYFLSVKEDFSIAYGDFLEFIGAFFWAGHVLLIGWLSPRVPAIRLASLQFAMCSALCLVTAFITETVALTPIFHAAVPILYGGLMSVGIAYTLQVVAQKDAPPSHAAILLSLEAVFAVIGGWLILNEHLDLRGVLGCSLMLSGMLLSQLQEYVMPWIVIRLRNYRLALAERTNTGSSIE